MNLRENPKSFIYTNIFPGICLYVILILMCLLLRQQRHRKIGACALQVTLMGCNCYLGLDSKDVRPPPAQFSSTTNVSDGTLTTRFRNENYLPSL